MGDEEKRQFKKRMYIAAGVGVFLSWYLGSVLQATFSDFGHTWNPFALLVCTLRYGFPFRWFLLFLIVSAMLILAFVVSTIRTKAGMDVMGRKFKMASDRQSYGQSHFERPDEYETKATIESPETAIGTIFGQLDQSGKRVIAQRMDSKNRGNRHVAVLGSSGSGKTYTFVKTSCYQVVRRRESIIITDPDGGLFRDMSGYFADNGYIVRHFDLNDIARSDGWDCLKSISTDAAELDAQRFSQTIMSNLVDDPTSIYFTGPMALLKALILFIVLDPNRKPEEKNIGEVYKLIQNPGGESFLDSIFDVETLTEEQKPCLGPYLSFKQGSPNLRGNLITNLSVQLQLLQSQIVCTLLSTDDINLELPGLQPCAYFCGFPDSHDTYRFIVSLFFSMIFIKLIHLADVKLHKPLPIPVNFLLDEFPSIGCLPDWDKKMATIRKRNMNVTMIFQDIMQFQNVYHDSWGTILGNCSTLLVLGINEDQSSQLVTKRIGDTTIEAKTEQHAATESFFTAFNKNSTGEGRRALVSYDELYKIHEDNAIILFQGHNPIFCWKFPHVLHPESKKLREVVYDEIPDIRDLEGRKKMREEEEARVSEYLREHPLEEVDRSYNDLYEPEPKLTSVERLRGSFRKGLLSLADFVDDEEEDDDNEIDSEIDSEDVSLAEAQAQETTEAYCPLSLEDGDFGPALSLDEVFPVSRSNDDDDSESDSSDDDPIQNDHSGPDPDKFDQEEETESEDLENNEEDTPDLDNDGVESEGAGELQSGDTDGSNASDGSDGSDSDGCGDSGVELPGGTSASEMHGNQVAETESGSTQEADGTSRRGNSSNHSMGVNVSKERAFQQQKAASSMKDKVNNGMQFSQDAHTGAEYASNNKSSLYGRARPGKKTS